MTDEWKWLASTKELQENTYGYDEPENMDDADVASYLDWNQVAAVQELAELREEFSWKPWATDLPFVHRERVLKEVVDVLHFIGNILHGIGVSDEALWEAYRRKQAINRARQASGSYSAQKGGLSQGSD